MACLLAAAFIHTAQATDYYVSTNGLNTNPGTQALPFKTVTKAANVMLAAGDTCTIAAGTYRETVTAKANNVTFQAAPGAAVVISGFDAVTNWTVHSNSIYSAQLTWNLNDENQLLYNNQMMNPARWPNKTDYNPFNIEALSGSGSSTTISNASIPNWNWSNGGVVYFLGKNRWTSWRRPITGSAAGVVSFATLPATWEYAGSHSPADGGEFFLENIPEALDSPGEWYIDRTNQVIYFWAPGGGSPAAGTALVRRRTTCFDLTGLTGVTLDGLQLEGGSINMTSATGCVVKNCRIYYGNHTIASTTAAFPTHSSIQLSSTSSQNLIDNNDIQWGAATGINLLGSNNTVSNNTIGNFNYLGSYAAPILLSCTGGKIYRNEIFNSGRDLVRGGWSGAEVSYNDLHDAALINDDCGAIYFCCASFGNTRIHHNWIHDCQSRSGYYKATGIYLDNSCRDVIVDHNVVWNVTWGCITVNWEGENLKLYNNTLWCNSGPDSVSMARWANGYSLINVPLYNTLTNQSALYSTTASNNHVLALTSNPFVDFSNRDFTPLPDPNVVNAGMVISGYTSGYQGSAPDIGAYESGAVPWTAGPIRSTLAVTAGTGGTVSGNTNVSSLPGYPDPVATVTATPLPNWHFSRWTGDVPTALANDNPLTVTVDRNRNISAVFEADAGLATLTVVSAHGGASPGTTVAAMGTPLSCFITNSPLVSGTTQYVANGGSVVGNDFTVVSPTNITLTLNQGATLTWHWTTNYRLAVGTNGSGSVSQTSAWVASGSNVSITATAAHNSIFTGWSGQTAGCSINGNVITATMTQARSIVANFTQNLGSGSNFIYKLASADGSTVNRTFMIPANATSVSLMVVGGGGGGGGGNGNALLPAGGGGGGQVVLKTGTNAPSPGTYSYQIGAGGAGAAITAGNSGSNGTSSWFGAITAFGGGGGGGAGSVGSGSATTLGSGGGGGSSSSGGVAGAEISHAGGNSLNINASGGGGGAGGAGESMTGRNGGAGGAGYAYSVLGVDLGAYAAGGGGGANGGAGGIGGLGGTTGHGSGSGPATAGMATTGSGGGGGRGNSSAGGSGGSGCVIVSYSIGVPPGNTPPTLSIIANQTVALNGSGYSSFTIGDTDTPASALDLSANSSNPSLVPLSGIIFSGTDVNRGVTITPTSMQVGTSTITINVSDGELTTSTSFTMTVDESASGRFAFLFNEDGNFEGWAGNAKVSGATVVGGALTATLIGVDPQFVRSTALNIQGSDVPIVLVRMMSSAGGSAVIYFGNELDGIVAANSVNFAVPAGNVYQWYAVNVAANANWSGHTIKALRLDPPASSGTISIDAIIGSDGDFNQNGLSDAWEAANQLDPTAPADLLKDSDGDDLTDAAEFVFGTNPTAPEVAASLTATSSGGTFTLTFIATQASGIGYDGLTRIFDMEMTDDLANPASWTGVAGYTNIIGSNQTVTVPQSLSAVPHFYRLKVRVQ